MPALGTLYESLMTGSSLAGKREGEQVRKGVSLHADLRFELVRDDERILLLAEVVLRGEERTGETHSVTRFIAARNDKVRRILVSHVLERLVAHERKLELKSTRAWYNHVAVDLLLVRSSGSHGNAQLGFPVLAKRSFAPTAPHFTLGASSMPYIYTAR